MFSTETEIIEKKHTKEQIFSIGITDEVIAEGIEEKEKVSFCKLKQFLYCLSFFRSARPIITAEIIWQI